MLFLDQTLEQILENNINWEIVPSSRNGLNVIGLALIATIFGYVFSKMGEQGKILLDIFETINEACILIIKKVMW